MIRAVLMFGGAFGVCMLIGGLIGACSSGDCDCPETPAKPGMQAPLSIERIASFDEEGNFATLGFHYDGGTLEVTGNEVIVRYNQDGSSHEVVYNIDGALP